MTQDNMNFTTGSIYLCTGPGCGYYFESEDVICSGSFL